jgi:Predicted integral membrane protein (DUF2269)
VSLDDWLLALHLISAFALIGALTIFTVMIAALWRTDDPAAMTSFTRLGAVGNALVMIGTFGTIVFGIWLAISRDAYHVWDGWVIVAIVLWALLAGIGQQTGQGYRKTAEMAERLVASSGDARSPALAAAMGASRAFWLHMVTLVLVVLILIDMIWKPGA